MSLDRIDIAILDSLQKDGRMSNATLAEKVGLSQSACSRRLDILEKSGVIRGYHARLSNKMLGHPVIVIVNISLSGQADKQLREFETAVKRCPNVLVCYLMSGEYDYLFALLQKISKTMSGYTNSGFRRCRMSRRSTRHLPCGKSRTEPVSGVETALIEIAG